MTSRRIHLLTIAFGAVLAASVLAGQQPAAPGVAAAQVATGRTVYDANCASCHLADLGGSLPRQDERTPERFAAFVKAEIARWSPILTVSMQ